MNELKPYDDLRNLIISALKDIVVESIEQGLDKLGLCPATKQLFATITMLAAKDAGAFDEMFARLVSDYVDGHMVTIEDLLRGKAQ